MNRSALLLAVLASLLHPANSLQAAPAVDCDAVSVTMRNGGTSLRAERADGTVTLRGGAGEFSLHPCLQAGEGWTRPEPAREPAVRGQHGDTATVTLTYPVAENRRFAITLSACEGVPAVFLTTRLEVLKETRGQYYYLQTSLPCPRYEAPAAGGVQHLTLDAAKWDSLPWRRWWLFPEQGVALLPTNLGGRAPGESSGIFLHALPRSTQLCPGDGLEVNVGFAVAGEAAAAEAAWQAAQARGVPALEPWKARSRPWDYGRPAPRWLREAEVYNLYYRNAAQWTQEAVGGRLKGFPLIVGSTPDLAALERCHRHGIKLLHYVVYTCLLDTDLQVRGGGKVYSEWSESVDCEHRDLKDHPDWIAVSAEGKPIHDAWGQEHGHPGLLNTCLHQRGLRQAAVHQVELLMQRGYDGVFIDLAGATVDCHGARLGKHQHEHPDWSNTQAYEQLLTDIYATVKRYGDNRIVMQNTCTGILPSHWASCDSQMLEACPYAAGSTELRLTEPELRFVTAGQQAAVQAGKVPVILPYFGGVQDTEAVKAAAETSYAWARLSGFLWADGFGLQDLPGLADWSRRFYARRLGLPQRPLEETAAGLSRRFASGTVRLDLAPVRGLATPPVP